MKGCVRGLGGVALVGGIALLTSCQVLLGYERFEGGATGGSAGDASGGVETSGGDRATGGGAHPASTCPSLLPAGASERGPAPLFVHEDASSCVFVDETEVTREQYAEFVAAVGSDDGANIEGCKGGVNPSFANEPGAGGAGTGASVPTTPSQYPVVRVDWCDAAAFCRWAGRNLCGEYDGQSLFVQACEDFGAAGFDPSSLAEVGVCNGSAEGLQGVRFKDCQTPSGVYDLVGNAREWTGECPDERVATRSCYTRGGSYDDTGTTLGCEVPSALSATGQYDMVGFRCCLIVPKG